MREVRFLPHTRGATDAPNVNEHKASLGAIGVFESADDAQVVRLPFLGVAELVRCAPIDAAEVLERVARRVLHEGEVAERVGESLEGDGEGFGEDVATGSVRACRAEVLVDRLEEIGRRKEAVIAEQRRNQVLQEMLGLFPYSEAWSLTDLIPRRNNVADL